MSDFSLCDKEFWQSVIIITKHIFFIAAAKCPFICFLEQLKYVELIKNVSVFFLVKHFEH